MSVSTSTDGIQGDLPPTSGTQQSTGAVAIELETSVPLTVEDRNYLLVVFQALLESVNVTQNLASTVSQMVELNASMQEDKNKLISEFQFRILPTDAKTNTINAVNEWNQNVTFDRQNIQSVVITLRQRGRTAMTQAQVTINYLQQNSSELTAILKIMIVVMQLINKVSQNQ